MSVASAPAVAPPRKPGRAAAALVAAPPALFAIYMGFAAVKGSGDLLYPEPSAPGAPPSTYGMPFERVDMRGHDGTRLAGWYVPAARPTTRGILLLHGYASNKGVVFGRYGRWLHDYNLFAYDSRRCGESAGTAITLGYFEAPDAVLAVAELKKRGNTRIGLFGESMGGAVGITAAARSPDVRCVWEDCAFDTLADAVGPRAALRGYPLTAWVAAAVVAGSGWRTGGDLPAADPIRSVAAIAPRPLAIVHGQQDIYTVPANGEKLYAAAKEPKSIWRTAKAGHADSYHVYAADYEQRLKRFFREGL